MFMENLDSIVNLLAAYCQRMHEIWGGGGLGRDNVDFIKIKTCYILYKGLDFSHNTHTKY